MRKKTKLKLLNSCMSAVILLSSVLIPVVANGAAANASSIATRIGGVDQYETAALIAQKGWSGSTDNIVLSSGMGNTLVDALAAGPLAAKLKAPILLTDGEQGLNSFTKAELQRLKPKRVYITSGTAVIKPSAIDEIKALGITLVPLGGFDQYETSVNIAKEMMALGVNVTKVVIASGWMAPVDALSVASIAATLEIPILATTQSALPPSVMEFLSTLNAITNSYVIGGTAVVGQAIEGMLPGTVHRFSGVTKFDTNLEVLKGFAADVNYEKVFVANGETFVDALSGVPLAALSRSPIVLGQSNWSVGMKDFLKLNNLLDVIALGGVAAVPDSALKPLTDISNELSNSPVIPPVTVTPPVTIPVIPPVQPPISVVTPSPAPIVTNAVTVSNLQINTNPANSLGTFSNGALIDLSGLDNSVILLGFGVTADQNCTLQFKVLDNIQNIPLVAGQPKNVTVADLITGGQIEGGVDLGVFRLIYQNRTKTLVGKLLQEGTSAGTLTVNLKFKN